MYEGLRKIEVVRQAGVVQIQILGSEALASRITSRLLTTVNVYRSLLPQVGKDEADELDRELVLSSLMDAVVASHVWLLWRPMEQVTDVSIQ